MQVLRFKDYYKGQELAEDLIEMLSNPLLNENVDDKAWKQILDKVFSDLGLNYALITTFGTGIAAMYPIVNELIVNNKLKIEITQENMLLLTVAAVVIIYLEEKKTGSTKISIEMDEDEIKENAKSLLTELKLRGIGNGIVKKVVKAFTSISNLVKVIFKNFKYVISGFIDMFAYTAMLVPTMNVFATFIDKYDMNLDSIIGNLLSVGVGVLSVVAKNSINYLVQKLGSKFNLDKDKIMKDLPEPSIKKYPHPEYIDVDAEQNGDLIKGNENKKV